MIGDEPEKPHADEARIPLSGDGIILNPVVRMDPMDLFQISVGFFVVSLLLTLFLFSNPVTAGGAPFFLVVTLVLGLIGLYARGAVRDAKRKG